jgi:3-oxoacyl-[acyl-carrier-protein] synthase-3
MKIIGTGSYVPRPVVTNESLEEKVNTSSDWIYNNLGIKERRRTNLNSSQIGTFAGGKALLNSKLKPEDIGLIIVATSTPDKLNPSTACMIQDNLECYNAVAFDINAVCSGFVYALDVAIKMHYRYSMVIGVDTFSHITDWTDRNCVFFGDGAGAVIIDNDYPNLCISSLKSDGRGRDAFFTPHCGTFEMNPKMVFEAGTTILPELINDFFCETWITPDQIAHVIPHQASIKMLRVLAEKIEIPFAKFCTNMERYGNTAGASIPIALDEFKSDFKPGELIMLASIGSGWTFGVIILEW